jgi:hypothetical protein
MYRILAAATVAALAATIGITSAAAAPATAKPSVTGTEHISIMSTSASPKAPESIIVTGVFTAGGKDVSGNNVDAIKLPGGSFKIHHAGPESQSLNAKTCLLAVNGTGTYKIAGGKGAYKGISGSGKYKLTIRAITARTAAGKCNTNAAPVAWQFMVMAKGPVSLP